MFKIVRYSRSILRLCEPMKAANKREINVNVAKYRLPKLIKRNKFVNTFCTSSVSGNTDTTVENSDIVQGPDIKKLAGGDEQIEHKLKVLVLEAEVLRQEGELVPENKYMRDDYWLEMLKLGSRSARKRYLLFLFKKHMTIENRKKKQLEKRVASEEYKKQRDENPEEPRDDVITYGFNGSNIFLRVYDTTMNDFYNRKLIDAMIFGQKLVIDCGYEDHMVKRESMNCAKQVMLLFAENRVSNDPFDLYLCNLRMECQFTEQLERHMPTMYDEHFPINVHEKSYLDMFPKQKLVYLTPHCSDQMEVFDHDAIYIIGGIVDKVNSEPLSLAKAKKEGIKMQKFPLDKYLQWGGGSGKSLTLNQCVSILNDIKNTGDWNYALRHVPRRKIVEIGAKSEFDQIKDLKYEKNIKNFKSMWRPNSEDFDDKPRYIEKYTYNRNKKEELSGRFSTNRKMKY